MITTPRLDVQVVRILEVSEPIENPNINPRTNEPYLPYLRITLQCEGRKPFNKVLFLDDDGVESIDMANLRTYVKHLPDIEDVIRLIIKEGTPITLKGRFIQSKRGQ